MRGALHVLVALALVGCDQGDEPQRVEHRAIYETDLGVFDLSLARLSAGGTMLFWTEGTFGRGVPTWMRLGDEQAHQITLPMPEEFGDRSFSRLLALDSSGGTFVTYGIEGFFGTPTLHEIVIDADGGLASYRSEMSPILGWLSRPVDAFRIGSGRIGFAGYNPDDFTYVVATAAPGQSLGGEAFEIGRLDYVCAPQLLGTSTPEGIGIVVYTRCLQEGTDTLFETAALALSSSGDTIQEIAREGPVDPPGDLLAIAANEAGVSLLVVREDGGLALHVVARSAADPLGSLLAGLFESVAWEHAGAVSEPRLFATDGRFVVAWNEEPDGGGRRTRAVVVTPGQTAGDAFDWPVSDEECPIRSAVAQGERLEYTCSARCQGAGCARRWVYRGEIELP